jgi:hypothetical protein
MVEDDKTGQPLCRNSGWLVYEPKYIPRSVSLFEICVFEWPTPVDRDNDISLNIFTSEEDA